MLSIAHYHPCLTGSGGDRVSEAELRFLAASGHRISFLVAYDPCGYEPALESLGASWKAFHGRDVSVRDSRLPASQVMPEALAFLREQRADVLHCHNVSILPQALMLSREAQVPLFITLHTLGERWAKWRYSYKPKRRRQFAMIREALTHSKGLFGVSRPVVEHARNLFGKAADHAVYLPNPIHAAFFEPLAPVLREFDVAILGRPVPMKNPGMVAAALGRLQEERPNLRVVWVGATGEEEPIRTAVRSTKLRAAIEFLGKRSPHEVRDALVRSKVLFLPSLREGLALAAAEAALCECRLVLSDIPALREHYSVPGAWLFPPKDVSLAVQALRASLQPDAATPDASKLGLLNESEHGERLLEAYLAGLGRAP